MRQFGAQSMVLPLRRVLVRRPDAAFADADPAAWHYTARPDLAAAQEEHDAFVRILTAAGAEVIRHDAPAPGMADAIYVHDPVLITERGAILMRMGKSLRRGEEEAIGRCLEAAGVPIHYRLHGDALGEAGDCLWLDSSTLAVGQGYRTNAAGRAQLREALGPAIDVVPVELPYFTGPDACLHLMSLISLVDADLAVVYSPLMPVPFRERLRGRGIRLVEVPEAEFATLGSNVLTLAPRHCVMLEGNPVTRERLVAAGCRVETYRGREISLKAEGGPTCLTRPVLRGG
ncbi:MAG: arginine deiminase family protein [Gemmatimonadota bacterium]|nr:arginine deiminase family protein [Gemmatimonadota bacterium]